MKPLFDINLGRKPKRNTFDLSHERKFSMNMGRLVPILCEEVIPGDSWKGKTEVMMRMAPMVAPTMHRVNVYTHFFFVPNRLVWNEWESFITGGVDGDEAPVMPWIDAEYNRDVMGTGSLADYLGFKMADDAVTINGQVNALPFRAYMTIFNEFYRDQNLLDPIEFSLDSGEATDDIITLRQRCWEKDYFTSALPWTQRGAEITLPLGDKAPIQFDMNGYLLNYSYLRGQDGEHVDPNDVSGPLHDGGAGGGGVTYLTDSASNALIVDNSETLSADLSEATSATVNELRRAMRLQEWLEKNARGGSRYIEQILSHFGVRSSDARLQRPEFLGGGKSPVVISEVLQTGETATTPQGNMAGHGLSVGNTHEFKKYFEEHGYIIGIMSVLPKTAYQQGIRRHMLKNDKFDYFWPELAHLGEQPVYDSELYATGDINSGSTFGYQSRYAEYKYIPSSVHGLLSTDFDFWHMGRTFGTAPSLNYQFVRSSPTHRIFADTDDQNDKLYVQVYNNLKAIRPIPFFSDPRL
jgi:hypothetical protein